MALYDDLVVKNRPAAAPETTYGMNNLSETNVLPWQRTLDSGTQGLLSDRINTANNVHALDDSGGAASYGQDYAKGHMPTSLQGGMGMSPNFTSALSTRATNQAGESLGRMKIQSDLEAPGRQGNALANAGTQMRGAEQLKLHNFQQQVQYQDKVNAYNRAIDAARAQVLGSILGGIGKVAGMVIGNGGGDATAGEGAATAGLAGAVASNPGAPASGGDIGTPGSGEQGDPTGGNMGIGQSGGYNNPNAGRPGGIYLPDIR